MSKANQDARVEALKLAVSRNAKLGAMPDAVVDEARVYADFILTGVVRKEQHGSEMNLRGSA
jgi:hypothetical protein